MPHACWSMLCFAIVSQLRICGATRPISLSQTQDGKACAFVVDAGSSGSRFRLYTSDNLAPNDIQANLVCPTGEGSNLVLFASSKEKSYPSTSKEGLPSRVLDMKQIVAVQADLRNWEVWQASGLGLTWWMTSHLDDNLRTPGELTRCVAHTLASIVTSKFAELECTQGSAQIVATGGVRSLIESGLQGDVVNSAVGAIGNALAVALAPIRFDGFRVLSQAEEGELEAEAVRMAATAVGVDNIAGVFSMGGASSQIKEFIGQRRSLLLEPLGYKSATGKSMEEVEGMFGGAASAAGWDIKTKLASGTWVGISSVFWAATQNEAEEGAKLPSCTLVRGSVVREKVWESAESSFTDLVQHGKVIILKAMLDNLFPDDANFFFCRKWKSSIGEITATLSTALAVQAEPCMLSGRC